MAAMTIASIPCEAQPAQDAPSDGKITREIVIAGADVIMTARMCW
jgi:hypothetical protein